MSGPTAPKPDSAAPPLTAADRLAALRQSGVTPDSGLKAPSGVDPPPRPRRDGGSGTLAAGQVLMAGVLALLLAALLNADALVRDAERLEFGTRRDVSLAVWEPVQSVANALGLSEPRRIADEALGRDFSEPAVPEIILAGPADTEATPTSSAPTNDGQSADTTAPPVEVAETTTTVAPTTTTTEPPRIPTRELPLELWVGGDSMAQVFGESLVRIGSDTEIIVPDLDYHISSGLTRPDFFNWPGHLTDVISNDDPEVMVVIFGANDAQGMELSNGVFQPFDDEWVAEYSARVGFAMDILTQDPDRLVIWVGQPIMRSNNFDGRMNRLNEIYLEQSLTRDQIVYMDTRAMFSGSDGGYEAFLPALDGEVRNLRQQDGTHLSRAGGDLLATAVLDLLGDYIDIETGRIATTTTTTTTTAGG